MINKTISNAVVRINNVLEDYAHATKQKDLVEKNVDARIATIKNTFRSKFTSF
jgi:hypothetical protein